MKAQELRIGNLIKLSETDEMFMVYEISSKGFSVRNKNEDTWIEEWQFEGIPLTEDWLLKAGFEDKEYKEGFIGKDFEGGNFILDFVLSKPYQKGEWNKDYTFDLNSHRFVPIKFVHQLQNLYWCLTGQELEFKD